MAVLDRREVMSLRQEIGQQRQRIAELEKTVSEQTIQIGNANGRVSRTTNANLELKRVMRENGINSDGLAA